MVDERVNDTSGFHVKAYWPESFLFWAQHEQLLLARCTQIECAFISQLKDSSPPPQTPLFFLELKLQLDLKPLLDCPSYCLASQR